MGFKKSLFRGLKKWAGGRSPGVPVSRFTMYRTLRQVFAPHAPTIDRCLVISGSQRLAATLGIPRERFVVAAYPEVDIRNLPYPDGDFDAVISDQVLEHVAAPPLQVIREAARVVRPGGYLVHTTCFVNPRHDAPEDYWRFSPLALRLLIEESGDEVLSSGAWGNRYVLAGDPIGLRFLPVNTARPRSLTHRLATLNQSKWPISTWVVARRGEGST